MAKLVGVIGGTGIGDVLLKLPGSGMKVDTPAGPLHGHLIHHKDIEVLAVGRHSAGHKVPPHAVNYAALALGMKAAGAIGVIATAAVGSLRTDWAPGTMAVVTDFLDFSGRNLTLFTDEVVHRDFSNPFDLSINEALAAAGGGQLHVGATYVCVNGPRYETPAEIRMYRMLGGDVVGMTAASEAIVMREAEMPYSCVSLVSNLASGLSDSPLAHCDVASLMQERGPALVEIILNAASTLSA